MIKISSEFHVSIKRKFNHMKRVTVVMALSALFALFGCDKGDDGLKTKFGIFTVKDAETVSMNGTIDKNSHKDFTDLLSQYPSIKRVEIQECEGASDTESSRRLSLLVHSNKINTHILDNGSVAVEGTDFFLAGIKRTMGKNAKLGVQCWSIESHGELKPATSFNLNHANHKPYMNYYIQVGFTAQEAKGFYLFTINAANYKEIHWMTNKEIEQYDILN